MTAELFIQYGLVRAESGLFPYNLKLLIAAVPSKTFLHHCHSKDMLLKVTTLGMKQT